MLMYSNRIITIMNEGVAPKNKVNGNLGTQILGVTSFFVTLASLYTINRFKRKDLMIAQAIGLILCLNGAGVATMMKNSIGTLVFIIGHNYVVNLTAVFWIYMPEVLNDNQLGVAATVFYINGILLSAITEYLISLFGVDGVFYIFEISQILALFFIQMRIKDTTGLTDHQKKQLYYP